MSPIRKVDDFRSIEISSWDDFVQEEIAGLHARGELDNLPDQGKPIKIWKTDINPEYDLAFSRLKNAGVMPLWMELDREIGERTDQLWQRLDWIGKTLRSMIADLEEPEPQSAAEDSGLWHRLWVWFREDFASDAASRPSVTEIIATRERERHHFLEMAMELDKKIVSYHDALPKGAESLQRLRWLPARAEAIFDERIALSDWWESSRA